MTTNSTPRPYRRTKATLLIIAAIIAFPLTIVILVYALNEGRR